MNCETCINKTGQRKPCRTMQKAFDDYSCHMTKEQAISIEKEIKAYGRGQTDNEVKRHIKWLESREG